LARKTAEQEKERLIKAVRLRGARFTYQQIADQVGYYDAASAKRSLDGYYNKLLKDEAQQTLVLELEYLDQMQRGLHNDAISGNVKAVAAMLKIMDQRAKYLRLYPQEERQELESVERPLEEA
jgi:hypothetical protein